MQLAPEMRRIAPQLISRRWVPSPWALPTTLVCGHRVSSGSGLVPGVHDDELPMSMRAPKECLSADDEVRKRKTAAFVHAAATATRLQDTIDMICAAMQLATLRETHLQAIMRRLKIEEADRHAGRHGAATEEVASSDRQRIGKRETPVPVRRMVAIAEVLLEHRYLEPSCNSNSTNAQDTLSQKRVGVSSKLFSDVLLWVLSPYVLRVKELAAQDSRGDALEDDDRPMDLASRAELSPNEIWSLVAQLELHNVPIESEVVLDALLLVLQEEDAAWRRTHSGTALNEEIRKNRLEFVDAQRNALRSKMTRERILNRRRHTPAPAQALSEVSPPPANE